MNIKDEIERLELFKELEQKIVDKCQGKIKAYNVQILELQKKCTHEWDQEVDPIGGMCVVTCVVCRKVSVG